MILVVGGHSRNIGKTSVVASLIRSLPEWNWTAMKITQFGHGVCSASGADCDCCLAQEHPFAILREKEPGASDTGRFLAAGARASYWVRTAVGNLGCAMPALRTIFGSGQNVIVESNSIMDFVKPDLYLVVLDYAVEDFKTSSRRFLDQAGAYILLNSMAAAPRWSGISGELLERKPSFEVRPPYYWTPALSGFVGAQLAAVQS